MKPLIVLFALLVAAVLAVGGCTNQQYAGINYGEVITPDGEHWIIAGGKDETNVSFKVTRPDGTTADYHADNADASTVINAMTEQYSRLMAQSLQMIQALMTTPAAP